MQKLICIGYGNMAKAVIEGLLDSALCAQYTIFVTGRDMRRADTFCKNMQEKYKHANIKSLTCDDSAISIDGSINIEGADVLLCVKPNGLESFSYSGNARIIYSLMAGIKIDSIMRYTRAQNFIRFMPNIGARIRESATCAYVKNQKFYDEIAQFLQSFGNVVFVDKEDLIDSSICTSGSSPAFIALMAQALIESGVYHGLTAKQSQELVAKSLKACGMMLETMSADTLKNAVISPSGTTIMGLAVLEKKTFKGIIMEASEASVQRARELSKL